MKKCKNCGETDILIDVQSTRLDTITIYEWYVYCPGCDKHVWSDRSQLEAELCWDEEN